MVERRGSVPPEVVQLLEEGRRRRLIGAGPLHDQVVHSLGFARAFGAVPRCWLDLGSGGGLPGLVLAAVWPTPGVLIEAGERRAAFLDEALGRLGWEDRVRVLRDRAEAAGRDTELRAAFDLVTARSFGPPAVTAECGAPFLGVGGTLVVSEPPPDTTGRGGVVATGPEVSPETSDPGVRWPRAPLAELGLEPAALIRDTFGYQVLRQRQLCPPRFPRRVGVPSKRPLYRSPA